MPITVNDFRVAVQQLGDNANLRLKEDGSGIATSRWERFKVGFFDLFRSADSIATKQTETVRAFLDAVRREQGPNMADVAESHLRTQLGGVQGVPLLGRAVTSTTDHLTARGGQNWLHNERLTRQAAHVAGTGAPQMPTLSSIVNPVCEELVAQAQEMGLPENKARELLLKYTVGVVSGFVDMPDISHAIEVALRDAAKVQGEGGASFRRLEPEEVIQIARDAAKAQIRERINMYFHGKFAEVHPFQEDFARVATERGFEAHLPVLSRHENFRLFKELESFAIQNAKEILSPQKMQALRDQVLDRIFTRQQEKLDQIEALDLPEGPAKTDMVNTCMATRSRMDANYFAQVQTVAEKIGAFADRVAHLPPEEQRIAAQELARQVMQAFKDSGAEGGDDLGNFIALAVDLLAARSGDERLDAIAHWMADPQASDLRAEFQDQMFSDDPSKSAVAGALNNVFGMFGKIDDYR